MAGLVLDPWQELVLDASLGERADGSWSAFEVGLVVSRQNGKGAILEARELAGLFLLGERLLIHSAHEFATASEALQRMEDILRGCPELWERVRVVKHSHGEEGVYLKDGRRLRYKTRTKGGGRGFSCDCLILDEAMIIPEAMHGALLPTLSARPNPQVWYTGSAVDQQVHDHGHVLARVRERGLKGDDPSLAYFEWSPDCASPDDVTPGMADDQGLWADTNPGVGIRISTEHIGHERRSLDPRTFVVERLGVGDWPAGDGSVNVIPTDVWAALQVSSPRAESGACFAFDVSPDRSSGAVGVAGVRDDGRFQVEVVEHKRGTGWIVELLVRLSGQYGAPIVCDATGPAGSLLSELQNRGVIVTAVSAKDHAHACGVMFDGVHQGTVTHVGQPELTAAVRGAAKRPLGDAWAWSRKSSSVDISPLVACTLALWGSNDSAVFGGGFTWS